jgi:L-lactate dehydrogenase (cytochrome)
VRVREVRDLVRPRRVELDATRRRLASCYTIDDLRLAARRLIPRPVFEYVDGAADAEISLAANQAALRRRRFKPCLLNDVSKVCTGTSIFGLSAGLPLALAPTGYTRMMHPDGEIGVARVAAARGLPYTLSTMATTSIESLRAALPDADLWFQLYVLRDPALTSRLVSRATEAGYRTLVVTVDTVVPGNRIRDRRNGLTIPPALTAGALAQIAARPVYWTRMLRSPAISFANFPEHTIEETISQFSPALDWPVIESLRARWPGPLVLKGPLGPADARRAVEAGVDGIQLSNHGGRQLDRTIAPADLIGQVREAVGPSVTLIVDSGIRQGTDLAVILGLGADAGSIGRAYLYGLMAGGSAGVERALDLLTEEFTATLRLLGVTSVPELRSRSGDLLALCWLVGLVGAEHVEQHHGVVVGCSRLGQVHDAPLSVGARQWQALVAERHPADPRMLVTLEPGGPGLDVVARPDPGEVGAVRQQAGDQVCDVRRLRVLSGHHMQMGHVPDGDVIPVHPERPRRRFEEQESGEVPLVLRPVRDPVEQSQSSRVGGQQVVGAGQRRGRARPDGLEQQPDGVSDAGFRGRFWRPVPRRVRGQRVQMPTLVLV